jgi:MFS transporter, DHA1 family, tetracycline resistance protein
VIVRVRRGTGTRVTGLGRKGLGGRGGDVRQRSLVLFLIVFVDLVGFGIVLPLLPLYADAYGATGTAIALLVVSYAVSQVLLAPVWGRISDRVGRRPVLLIGLVGSAASYVLFAFAGSLWMLLLSRVLAGVAGANVPVAQAYIADVTSKEDRAVGMGTLGAAFGLGFVFGPAIGGVLAPYSSAAPGLAAALLCAGNALLAFFFLPESLNRAERLQRRAEVQGAGAGASGLAGLRTLVSVPQVASVLVLSFLVTAAFSAMHPIFSLFADRRFSLDARAVGGLFTFLGVVSALMQGVVVRKMVPRIGEEALVRIVMVPFVLGFLALAAAPSLWVVAFGLAGLAIGFGGALPCMLSLLSRAAPDALQGSALGVGQSVSSLARVAGPMLGGISWDLFGGPGTFLVGAALAGLALFQVAMWPRSPVVRQPSPS